MEMKKVSLACVLTIVSTPALAQETYYSPAPLQNTASTRYLSFPAGTPVHLVTRTDLSTKDARPGDRVYLTVAESLVYNGQTVLPAGAPVVAEVARADRNGHFGVKGKLAINLRYVQTAMGPVQLTGAATREGRSGTALSVGTFVFVSMLGGFLIHGTSAKIPYGTPVEGYLSESLKFWAAPQQVASLPSVDVIPTQAIALTR